MIEGLARSAGASAHSNESNDLGGQRTWRVKAIESVAVFDIFMKNDQIQLTFSALYKR